MKESKDYSLLLIVAIIALAFGLELLFHYGVSQIPAPTHKELDTDGVVRDYSNTPVDVPVTTVTVYYDGEMLYPDYPTGDTLIVTNAKLINQLIHTTHPTTDAELDAILNQCSEVFTTKPKPAKHHPVAKFRGDEHWYYDGEVLYPNKIHKDTLIVTRANYLNKMMTLVPPSSKYEMNIALGQTTVALKGRTLDLPEELRLSNKTDDLSVLISKDTITIGFQ